MNVLFVSSKSLHDDSYTHRILQLKAGLEKFGVRTNILCLGNYPFNTPSILQPLNIPSILRLMKGYEIIHGGSTVASYVIGLAKSLIKSKIVYDIHGDPLDECRLLRKNVFNPIDNYLILQAIIMESVAIKHSDYFIPCSKKLEQHYIDKGIEKDRIKVIRNVVDTELFKPRKINSKNEDFTVTYAGAFEKWQGIDNLILAAKLLETTNIRFKIIGFTKKDSNLKRKIKKLLNNKVQLIDRISRSELINHLNSSDICIIPRNNNPTTEVAFPTKFAEYIATGKPVIVTRVGEISTFVKKYDCGFVCEPTVQSIAETILEASETPSEVLFEKGINGRRLAENEFDQRVISKQYLEFLSTMK